MSLFMGLDVSTQSAKAVIIGANSAVVGRGVFHFEPLPFSNEGRAEQQVRACLAYEHLRLIGRGDLGALQLGLPGSVQDCQWQTYQCRWYFKRLLADAILLGSQLLS